MRKGMIYKATCVVIAESYVGKTVRKLKKRIAEHIYDSERQDTKLYRTARKYGWNTFVWEVVYDDIPEDQLLALEIATIAELDTYHNGLNSTIGGEDSPMCYPEVRAKVSDENHYCFGKPLKEETKQRLSLALSGVNNPSYGKPKSEETRAKIRDKAMGRTPWNKGIPRTDEVKEKLRTASTGRIRSEESRAKQSASVSGEKNPMFGKTGPLSPNYGKPKSEDTLSKMSAAASARYNKPDLSGMVFGKWTVLCAAPANENRKQRGKRWHVVCVCGTVGIKRGSDLECGKTTRCRTCSYADRATRPAKSTSRP